MASLPLYARNSGVCNRYATFPDDFHVIDHAIIDDDLVGHEGIVIRRWFRLTPQSTTTHYARATDFVGGKFVPVLLHRVVWEIANSPIPDGLQVDHINRNGLDNRLENLRVVNYSQQIWNRGKSRNKKYAYKGVDPKQNRWRSYVSTPTVKKLHLGAFDTMEEAAVAYDIAASQMYGEYAELNNIPDELVSPEKKQAIERKVLERIAGHSYA